MQVLDKGSIMHKRIKIICGVGLIGALIVCAKLFALRANNDIDIPILFLLVLIGVIFFMWLSGLKKKDQDKGFM